MATERTDRLPSSGGVRPLLPQLVWNPGPQGFCPAAGFPGLFCFLIPPCLKAFVVGFAAEEESESVVHFLKDFVFPADCDPFGSLLPSWLPVSGSLLTWLQRLTWRS